MKKNPIQLIDTTVREAGFLISHQLEAQKVADLAQESERCGFPYAEICHGCGIGGFRRGYPGLHHDIDLLKAARKAAHKLKLCVYLDAGPHSITELELISDYFDLGKVGVNVTTVDSVQEHIKRLKGLKKTVAVQLLRVHRVSAQEAASSARRAEDLGADIVYLVDSYGSMSPDEVGEYFEAVQKKTNLPLGFQGRNNTQRAIANSVAAVRNGATWIDTSLLGAGRDAGIANAAILVFLLQRDGYVPEINLPEIHNASWWHLFPRLRQIPCPDLVDLLYAKHRIDFYPKEFIPAMSNILEISAEEFLVRAKKQHPHSLEIGQQEIRDVLASEGLNLEVVMEYLQTGRVPGMESN